MALNAYFYTFAKYPNSTKLPDASTAVQAQIELKAPTTILNPQIKVAGIPAAYVWNYVYISEFSRYYWIINWEYADGLFIGECKVDVLGSYRAAIRASSQYVLRSASASNGYVVDTMYPIVNGYQLFQNSVTLNRHLTFQYWSGYFIIGVISKGNNAASGAVSYYALDFAGFRTLKNAMFNDISWAGISDISTDLTKALVNPFDYIVSCKWCPYTMIRDIFDTAVTQIPIGFWNFTVNAYIMSGNVLPFFANSIDISASAFGSHPQASRGIYLNGGEYTEYNMLLAPYGVIHLPADCARHGIHGNENIDVITGECTLRIWYGDVSDGYVVPAVTVKGQMFSDVQIAQVRNGRSLQDIGTAVGADLIGKAIDTFVSDGAIKSVASGIVGAVHEMNAIVSVKGDNEGYVRFFEFGGFNAVITAKYALIADEDMTHLGRPLCEVRTLSTLSGYCLCADPEIATVGTDGEQREIINFLATGFYLE